MKKQCDTGITEIYLLDDDVVWNEKLSKKIEAKGSRILEIDSVEEYIEKQSGDEWALCLLDIDTLVELYDDLWKEVIKNLCDKGVPIVLLAQQESEEDELLSLRMGIRDYFEKTKELDILWERCKLAIMKKGLRRTNRILLFEHSRTIQYLEKKIILTPLEFLVFSELYRHKGEVVSRTSLMEVGWANRQPANTRVLDTVIRQLRCKCEDVPIHIGTIYQKGYCLDSMNMKWRDNYGGY